MKWKRIVSRSTRATSGAFVTAPSTAHRPDPRDGSRFVDPNVVPAWRPGLHMTRRDVYFGTDRQEVLDGTPATFRGRMETTTFDPGPLAPETTYFWRIDEIGPDDQTHPGSIWSFVTLGPGGGLKADYFDNMSRYGEPAVTRIDLGHRFHLGRRLPRSGPGQRLLFRAVERGSGARVRGYVHVHGPHQRIRDALARRQQADRAADPDAGAGGGQRNHEAGRRQDVPGSDGLRGGRRSGHGPVVLAEPRAAAADRSARHAPAAAAGARALPGRTEPWIRRTTRRSAGRRDGRPPGTTCTSAATTRRSRRRRPPTPMSIWADGRRTPRRRIGPFSHGDQEYYWRIDEVNEAEAKSPWKGNLWRFATADFIPVDDFESYSDHDGDRIYEVWIDGWINGTGSTVGYLAAGRCPRRRPPRRAVHAVRLQQRRAAILLGDAADLEHASGLDGPWSRRAEPVVRRAPRSPSRKHRPGESS